MSEETEERPKRLRAIHRICSTLYFCTQSISFANLLVWLLAHCQKNLIEFRKCHKIKIPSSHMTNVSFFHENDCMCILKRSPAYVCRKNLAYGSTTPLAKDGYSCACWLYMWKHFIIIIIMYKLIRPRTSGPAIEYVQFTLILYHAECRMKWPEPGSVLLCLKFTCEACHIWGSQVCTYSSSEHTPLDFLLEAS